MKAQPHVTARGLTNNHNQTATNRIRLVILSLALAAVAALSHAAERDDWIPGDRPSAPPLLVTWDRPIEDVSHPGRLTVQVSNPRAGTIRFNLNVVAFGLDFRTVRRSLGTFQLGDFGRMTHTISVRDLPIQSVSHSSELTVEAVIPRWSEKSSLSLPTPPAYYHFSADYSTVSVYGFDTMMDRVSGGRHAKNLFSLQGRAWNGKAFVEINALRRQEAKAAGIPVVPILGPSWAAPYAGGGIEDTPPPYVGFPVCVDWKTRFVDASAGDYATSSGDQFVDAAYAKAEIRKVYIDPCWFGGADECTELIWSGYLDSQGCVLFEPTENQMYVANVYSELKKGNITSKIEYFNSSQTNKGVTGFSMSFVTPLLGSSQPYHAYLTTPYHATTNVAATMSRLLSTSESGMMDGAYDVHANIGCLDGNPGPGIPPTDSCASSPFTYIGPLTVPGSPIPGDIAWKFVIAHEFGHQVQRKSIGIPGGSYDFSGQPDPPAAPPSCRCDHVVSANQLHCLQSQERWSAAEREGFAHFMAAKVWNKQTQSDCSFNYYKEFRLANGTVKPPPHLVDCRNAVQWRDNHCFKDSFATEFDWMQFLWNVNTVGADKVSSADLKGIYKEACGGSCSGVAVTWSMMNAGALKFFGSNSNHPKFKYFKACGDTFGVDLDQF